MLEFFRGVKRSPCEVQGLHSRAFKYKGDLPDFGQVKAEEVRAFYLIFLPEADDVF